MPEIPEDSAIVRICSETPKLLCNYGNKVAVLSEDVVVKFGEGVAHEEYANLQHVHGLLDPAIVRVPMPYHFFQHDNTGYLVMEYVKGSEAVSLSDAQFARLGNVLTHFASLERSSPGPCGGGISRGLIWDEGTTLHYKLDESVEKLQHWFNRRLSHQKPLKQVEFGNIKFVLCHLDIAPRNIIWREDEIPCILDWASAGYYPGIFEWLVFAIAYGQDGDFQRILIEQMRPMNEWEQKNCWVIKKAWENSVRYYL